MEHLRIESIEIPFETIVSFSTICSDDLGTVWLSLLSRLYLLFLSCTLEHHSRI